jgi:hypothetical protein
VRSAKQARAEKKKLRAPQQQAKQAMSTLSCSSSSFFVFMFAQLRAVATTKGSWLPFRTLVRNFTAFQRPSRLGDSNKLVKSAAAIF